MINRRLANIFKIGLVLFVMLSVVFAIFCITNNAVASSAGSTKFYTSIQIEDGDTLWDIADENHVEGTSTNSYMNEICSINGIETSSNIKAGDYLTIYYLK